MHNEQLTMKDFQNPDLVYLAQAHADTVLKIEMTRYQGGLAN